jgi:uncharacterized cupredoxin-like copper-binding protein
MKQYKDTPYYVSEDGKVFRDGKELKQTITERGYHRIKLSFKTIRVHRVVAELYIPNPDNKSDVNHKDGNKSNNSVSNLEWLTHKENMEHAKINNLMIKGENHPKCKLNKKQVEYIKINYIPGHKEYGMRALARKFNVSKQPIHDIIYNKTWK